MTLSHVVALIAAGVLFAALPSATRAAPPDKVWVAPHTLPNGTVIPGCWRETAAPGYTWIEGRVDEEGRWIPGYWRPQGVPARNKIWVAGYWMDGVWHSGRWITPKVGRAWSQGHYDRHGRFVPGHWR